MNDTTRSKASKQESWWRVCCQAVNFGCLAILSACAIGTTGCSSVMTPISGVPAHRLPQQFHAPPKNNLVPVDISRLRKPPAREYLVDGGDILGIYIESVLGSAEEPPPVHMPDRDSDLPPSIGYPIPVRENGTLPLPLVPPLQVRGLTLQQIETAIRRAYTIDQNILPPGKDRIIVTLMRKRTYHVVVMRQDGGVGDGKTEFSTRGQAVELDSTKNDVLNALAVTGGLPGVNAKDEVIILKASRMDPLRRDQFVREFYATPIGETCLCRPPLPQDPAVIKIPLRLPPGVVPQFNAEDVALDNGDIVYIESREREVFYTGGLLGGGEHQLPRDYDLDVLGALAIAGKGVLSSGGGGGGGMGGGMGGGAGGVGGVPPGQLFILRKTPCNDQITIAVDLTRAINSPNARPLIYPGDILILQYKPEEEILNFSLGTFFTYGIRQLFQGNR